MLYMWGPPLLFIYIIYKFKFIIIIVIATTIEIYIYKILLIQTVDRETKRAELIYIKLLAEVLDLLKLQHDSKDLEELKVQMKQQECFP